jgi:cytochrome c6
VKNGYKRMMYLLAATLVLLTLAVAVMGAQTSSLQNGEAGFREYCVECHADGGNIINPAKSLSKADREKNGIRTAIDIIKIMRKPGEGMTPFDEKTLPETEAVMIAEYILTTFK